MDYPKSAINWKNDDDVMICEHDVIVKLFCEPCRVSLVKFSYCFKFHVNIIPDSGVVAIFV